MGRKVVREGDGKGGTEGGRWGGSTEGGCQPAMSIFAMSSRGSLYFRTT